jgi:glutathione S-transferase
MPTVIEEGHDSMLKILGRVTSSNTRKVLWALDELNLHYEREDWGLPNRDPNVPEFLSLNPNAQVPVFIENGFSLWESNAILLYLAEREGMLLPDQLEQRALAFQWLSWQASDMNAQSGYAVRGLIRKAPGFDDPAKIADAMKGWGSKLGILEQQLQKTGAFVAGETFSVADIAIGISVHRWMVIPADKPPLPAVDTYYEVLRSRPAGARWMTIETP